MRDEHYNDELVLSSWALSVVDKAIQNKELTEEDRIPLLASAKRTIETGGWRGNISERWVALGYKFSGMYL